MSNVAFLRRLPHGIAAAALGAILAVAATAGLAATTSVAIGFDTDDNPGTGCTLVAGSSAMPGVEVALYTIVTTTPTTGTVGVITRRTCVAGAFGVPVTVSAGGWAVGMAAGLSGSDLVETFIPLADLGGAAAAKIGAITAGDSLVASGLMVLLDPQPAARIAVPALSPLSLLILLLLVGGTGWLLRRYAHHGGRALLLVCVVAATLTTASALAIILDGDGTDWTGISPLATDPAGDAPAGQDLVALYAVKDGANLALRVDMVLARDAANQQPGVNAGVDQTITLPATAMLNGSATDDGLPNPPAAVTTAWTKFSGPGTVTFGNVANAATSAGFSVAGSYVLRLTASDSALSGHADVTITVNAAGAVNQAPIVSAGANQAITLPATATLAGTVTDDGLPNPPAHFTTTWSFVSGPASGVVFGNPATPGTSATFAAPGDYMLRLTASDGTLSASSDMQVTVNDGAPLLLSVADRTIALGTRFQQLLVAQDGNVGDTLTYALLAAPAGAALSPSPLVDWTPTAAQLGLNTFTARVTDTAGHTAQTTFHVTVVHTNQPPQLAPQANVILPVGIAFSRTLQATDPDPGDTLTFALVSGPAGMTLSGAVLNWPTAGKAPGDYAVTVRVADGGLFDSRQFTVTLTPAAPPPVAKDDNYEVRLGETLTISAPGVLGNDVSFGGKSLSALKLSDPDKGTLNAFNADGGFNYTAPATLPPVPGLNPVVSWRLGLGRNNQFALAADFNHDGVVDYVSSDFGNLRAWRGSDGSQLWQWDRSITTHADISHCGTAGERFALGDVTGGGDIYLLSAINCDDVFTAGFSDRYYAVNASQILAGGKVATQWLSPRLSRPHPGAYATATSPTLPDPPVTPFRAASAFGSVPTLAKLTDGGSTKLLSRFLAASTYGYYYDTPNSGHLAYAACRTITGLAEDEGRPCKATFVIDAATGAIDQVLTTPNTANETNTPRNSPTEQSVPIIADVDGDGQVEIISGGDVWKLVGGVWTLAWQAQFDSTTSGVKKSYEPSSVAVADLDGDGKAEVIFHLLANSIQTGGVYIFDHQGTLLRKIPIGTNVSGLLSVADVDGDGAPEILVAGDSFLYAYRPDGALLWAKRLPDILTGVVPPIASGGTEPMTSDSQLYVYDLDLDGVPEVIVQGTRRLFILNGRTGAELWSIDTENDGFFQPGNPLLVDADGDGHVDITVHVSDRWNCSYGGGPVTCLGSAMRISGANHNWAPGPKVQNQLNFRPAASDDSAKILYDGSVRRDFRQQMQQGTVVDPRIAQSTAFTYKANDGAADSAPATVLIDIKPQNRPPVITSTPPTGLLSVTPYTRRVYTITATDPDPGDSVHYELVANAFPFYFQAPAVDPVTGGVDLPIGPCGSFGGPCDFGRVLVIVAAVDAHGARTEQSFFVDISYSSVAVPNVIGQLLPAARTAIEAASLTPLVVTELFGPQAAGTVLGQDPLAGTANVPRSATVRLTVSKGPQPVVMPFVVGQQLAPTNALLTSAGLTVNVSTTFSNTIPTGEIMAQSPVAGTELLPATAPPVDLTVSAGGPLPAPIASIVLEPGPGPLLRLAGDELQYKAVAVLTDGTSADVTLTAAWSSSLTGVATINTVGVAKAIANGATTISASLGGKTGQGTLNVASRVLGDNTPPTAAITSPADGGAVIGPTPVVGTASDTNFLRYELAIAPAGDENYTLIAEGTTAVTGGTLGTIDPTTLINDLYTLRLTVFDRSENQSVATRTVQVSGDRKVGLFTLTYQDLNVPAAGIPLTIHRTYDSRDKAKGDFGIGWRLRLQTLRLRANRVLGTGWVRIVAGSTVTLTPTSEHKVSVTLPDGRVEEFDMIVSPTSNIGSLDFTNVTGFRPRPGTQGQLQALGNNSLLIVNGGAQDELVDDYSLDTYSPKLYRYIGLDGTQTEISPTEGVKKVTDPNGNAVTFGPGGILHSDGRGIVFTRDSKDRIVAITDLLGNAQTYAYDGNGDLTSHTNPVGGLSRYAYDRRHGLIEIRNALGTSVTRNEYDAAGRLIAMTDADGKQITFAHNDAANEDIVTDRLGHQERILYDEMGNIARKETVATIEGVLVNVVTTSTFDALGNETTNIDPDGRRTLATYQGIMPLTNVLDPAGLNLTTTVAYNARNDVTSATDAAGRPFTFTYDASGNLLSANLPDMGSATVVNNAQGQPIEHRDARGTRTLLTRDAAGRVTREEVFDAGAAQLRRVDTTWDANANKTSETLHRTIGGTLTPLTTRYSYDAANRLIAITDPLGSVSRTEYDANGQIIAEVDALGRRTSYTYDTLGRRTRTTHPDATFDSTSYDAEGNEVATTDRAGRTATHVYDELKQRVRTTHPDGSFTLTTYTAGGRVAATVDARGNRTDYAFDAVGRLILTTLPPVASGPAGPLVRPQMSAALNPLGAPISRTDPNGRITTYQYDANGRLTQTTYPDGSTTQQTWDSQGRRASVTNEEGQVTTFAYDGLSRLVSVAGLAGDATYAYDEAGNVLTQTDALGQVSRLRYDSLNRLVERQYPGGETERFAYDAVGNPVTRTDGSGRVTTLMFDAMNRLTKKVFPGGANVAYTYTADGQRASVSDSRGVTTYAYDSLGRLASISHPTGETVNYARDANGNLLSLAAPAATVNYGYDALDRLMQVTAPEGQSHVYYDLAGNRVRQTAANGIVTDATFDARNRVTQLTHLTASSAVLQSFTSVYSPAGRRTRITEQDGSVETYGYDAKGRLASEARTGTNPFSDTHAYDAVGNRLQTVHGGTPTTFSYNNNGQLLADGTATYAWDANGNLERKTQGATATQYGFDAENRLVSILGDSLSNQYAYDADGNRVQASTATSATRFLVDTANNTGLSQILEEKDGSGTLQARYSYGSDLLAMVRGGTPSFELRDALGSTRALADTTGAITDRYQYDAWGNAVSTMGSTVNPYRYRGERLDADSGLYQLRARYYSPSSGRFLSRDPLAGRLESPVSQHRYLYANADPIRYVDPTGKESSLPSLIVAQSISNTMKLAETASKTNQACNAFSTLGTVGYTVMAAQLAYGAVTVLFEGIGSFKSKFSVFGINPAVFRGRDIKKVSIGLATGPKLSLDFGMKDGTSQSGSLGPDGFNVSTSGPITIGKYTLKKELKKCETIPVGSVMLKQTSTNWMGIPVPTLIPALSIQVSLLDVISNEWKLYDGMGVDLKSPTGFSSGF